MRPGDVAQAERVWVALDAGRQTKPARFNLSMMVELPPVAQRYFARAIEPATPLNCVVKLEMEGTFMLNGGALQMRARQIPGPPGWCFVWQVRNGQWMMRFAGSRGYLRTGGRKENWTKFWLTGLVLKRASVAGRTSHAPPRRAAWPRRSGFRRRFCPQFGATGWQTGPDRAELRFADTPDLPSFHLTFDAQGDIVDIMTLCWSDANLDQTCRLQSFGGRMLATAVFQGFRFPVTVELGNLCGTPD